MSEETRNKGETRAGSLRERFESNIRMIEKTVWQDEKDFTLEVPVNLQNDRACGKGKKSFIPDENLLSSTKKMSKKIMVSAAILWYGLKKPFLLNNNDIKLTKKSIADICVRSCFLL